MQQFSSSFCLMLLHSLWQAGLLLLLFKTVHQKNNPGQNRNFLFLLLFIQAVLSSVTFYIYYTNQYTGLNNLLAGALLQNDLLQQAAPWIFVSYSSLLVFRAVQIIYRWQIFYRSYSTALQKPSVYLKNFTNLNSHYFGIHKKVSLWLSTAISAPVTFGYFKPVILLPVTLLNNITTQQAETLILHELKHIKANDFLLNWFLIIAENIFFFNPFILTLCRQIRMEREKSCDLTVLNYQYSPVLYAQTLLQAERQKQLLTPNFQLAAVGNKQQLLQRIHFFSACTNKNKNNRGRIMMVMASFFIFIICTITVLQFGTKTTKNNPGEKDMVTSVLNNVLSEINNPVFINNIMQETAEIQNKVNSAVKDIKISGPSLEKKLKQLKPTLERLQINAGMLAEAAIENYITPVALQDVATQQIIINEEQSGSKNATVKVYKVSYINGQWVLIPDWKASAKQKLHDSSKADEISAQ